MIADPGMSPAATLGTRGVVRLNGSERLVQQFPEDRAEQVLKEQIFNLASLMGLEPPKVDTPRGAADDDAPPSPPAASRGE